MFTSSTHTAKLKNTQQSKKLGKKEQKNGKSKN